MPLFRRSRTTGEVVKYVFFLYVASDLEAEIPEAIFPRDGRPRLDVNKAISILFGYPTLETFRRWIDDGRRLRLINEQTFLGFATIGIEDKLETFTSRSAMAARMFVEGSIVTPTDDWGEHIYAIPSRFTSIRASLAVAGELIDYPPQVIRVNWDVSSPRPN